MSRTHQISLVAFLLVLSGAGSLLAQQKPPLRLTLPEAVRLALVNPTVGKC